MPKFRLLANTAVKSNGVARITAMNFKLPKLPLVFIGGFSLLAGCSANPGPAPVEEASATSETTATSTQAPADPRAEILGIGIDQITGGLNPHLGSDDSVFVRELASLVLPSAFVDGVMNADLLLSAEVIEPYEHAAQTVRYVLQPEAQWSDGTPITVADFQYLWEAIIHNADTKLAPYYERISDIRSSQGGRTIEVDFDEQLEQWPELFQNLLPAHAMSGARTDFSTDLTGGYPASGGRYQLTSYDQQRGILTLERNDRFWGQTPTRVEQLRFVEVRSANHGAEMLRSGQIDALNITPTQVAQEMFELIPGTRVSTSTSDIVWRLVATEQLSVEQRRRILEHLDIPALNRLATQRTTQQGIQDSAAASIPSSTEAVPGSQEETTKALPGPEAAADLDDATGSTPPSLQETPGSQEAAQSTAELSPPGALRIGVNPEDEIARNAARVMVDMLQRANIAATIVESDPADLYGSLVPDGEVDMVFMRNAFNAAERFGCPSMENFYGYCDLPFQVDLDLFFDGALSAEDLVIAADEMVNAQVLETTLVYDERLSVLGRDLAAEIPEDYGFDTLADLVTWEELQEN